MPLITRLALVFAGGAAAGAFVAGISPWLLVLLLVLLLTMLCRHDALLLAAFAVAGLALGSLQSATRSTLCPPPVDGAKVEFTGVLEATPGNRQRTVVVRNGDCRVRVRVPDDAHAVMGETAAFTGEWMTLRITESRRPENNGLVLARTVRVVSNEGHPLLAARARTQQRIHDLFPAAYPLAEALLIAQRENLDKRVREDFAASGLTHLLAISGTHVALVGAVLMLFARIARLSRRSAGVAALLGSAAYVFFLGAPFAALRSLIQMALLFASYGLQRPAQPLGLLAVAAIAITAMDPAAPLDAGFQLSFAGITGIVLWRRPLIDLLPASLPHALRDAMATTVAASVATTPIAAFHFGTVSAISLIANLLAIPAVSLAVPAAAAVLAIGGINEGLAAWLAPGAELSLLWLNSIALRCAAVPGAAFPMTQPAVLCGVAAAAMAGFVFHAGVQRRVRPLVGAGAAACAGLLPIVGMAVAPGNGRALEIHMIDVGQGDAVALRSPAGRWLLVDAGPVSERYDAGKQQVAPYLLRHGAASLAAVLISHPHLDHFGGLRAIAERLRVDAIVDPAMAVTNAHFDSLLAAAQQRRIPWLHARPDTRIEFDGVSIEFLAPERVVLDARADANEVSAVFRLSFGEFSALFLGDLPATVEAELVTRVGAGLDVDLLKVGHHGSAYSSSAELLLATTPAVALVSAGRRNRYGHPHPAALNRLELAGARVFRTDRDGSVVVRATRDGTMTVRTRE